MLEPVGALTGAGEPGLLEVLRGEAGCRDLAKAFYTRVATNTDLRGLFPGRSLRCAINEFTSFLIQFLEGDESQTQDRWWLSLRESHARFEIGERQRTAWFGLMREAVESVIEDANARTALHEFFEVAVAYIVDDAHGSIGHDELSRRWSAQLGLDRQIEDLSCGRDEDAMTLAREFSSRPSVMVGIMARMMEGGREPLIGFVQACLRDDLSLASSCFNGRTLLHHAAGLACLPVVRHLLEVGVDPDVLDRGGHTPLYRVARPGMGDGGGPVVEELVRAGANVDHQGGVSMSTPLHQAARFGDLAVVRALLAAGADPSLRDRRGITPLDRARNCRRHAVADLLATHGDASGLM